MAINLTVANESSDLEIDQEGNRNIAIIRNVSSTTIHQCISQSGDDDFNIVSNVVEYLVRKVCENEEKEKKTQKEAKQRDTKLKPKSRFNIVTRSMTKQKERTGVQKDVLYDEKNENNPSKGTVKTSKDSESDKTILDDEAASLDLVLTALNALNRKVHLAELKEYIRCNYPYEVSKLRKTLNLGVKNNYIQKSGGEKGRIMYEARQVKANKDTDEDTTELELTFKTTATETTFKALQRKKGNAKTENDKKLILEALLDLGNKGFSATCIREFVNMKKKLSLQDVRNILEECAKRDEVEKIKKKNAILYKLK